MLRPRRHNAIRRTLHDIRNIRVNSTAAVEPPALPQNGSNEFISIEHGTQQSSDGSPRNNSYDGSTSLDEHLKLPLKRRYLAVKDNIATSQSPTTCASGFLKDHQSPFEATVVGLLRQAGASLVGKTNLDEFGMGSHSINSFFGPVQNLDFQGHSVGGSSGGSAAAVASGEAHFALGTDTGGSVRLPAAYTGVVGYKPSYGLISRYGVVPYANSLDTVGIFSPSARLLNKIFTIVRQHDPRDPTSVTKSSWKRMSEQRRKALNSTGTEFDKNGFKNFKIGVPIEYNIEELDESVREAWINALDLLDEHGCTIVPISLPNTKHALSAYYVLAPAEAASNLSKYDGVRYGSRKSPTDGSGDVLYSKTRGEGFGDEVKRRILLGSYTLSSKAINNYFIKAQRVRRLVQRDFDRVFSIPNPLHESKQFDLSDMDESIPLDSKLGPSQVDMIICPTAPSLPPLIEDVSKQSTVDTYTNDIFTVPASLAGLPAISIPSPIPARHRRPGAPEFAGIQIIGQYADDDRVLSTARILESLLYPRKGSSRNKHLRTETTSRLEAEQAPPLRETTYLRSPIKRQYSGHLFRKYGAFPLRKHGYSPDQQKQDVYRRIQRLNYRPRLYIADSDLVRRIFNRAVEETLEKPGLTDEDIRASLDKDFEDALGMWDDIVKEDGSKGSGNRGNHR